MEIAFMIGRVLFGGYFVYSGYNHFKYLANMTGYAQSKGIKAPKYSVILTGVLLVLGGLYVLSGFLAHVGVVLLLIFLIPTTYKMHQFWKMTDPMQAMNEKIQFTKNVALIGALFMMLAIPAPWVYSLTF